MFEKFFDPSPRGQARVRSLRNSPHGLLLEGFSRELFHSRYANITARRLIRSAEHFIAVATDNSIPVLRWDSRALESFYRHLSRRRCSYGHNEPESQVACARLFLRYLRTSSAVRTPLCDPIPVPAPLVAFRRWMREERGTCDATLGNYDTPIRELLNSLGEDPERFHAASLRRCFVQYCAGRGHVAIKHGATALRMFLRFLITEGKCPAGLEAAIPLVPHWRLSSLPRYLQPDEVERILASCDSSSSVGKRDRAILLLLARLGLRAGDIVQLHLRDIDWKDAWVRVCGKGGRQTRLPLTQEVGDAIVDYLQDGRPQTDDGRVFVCCRAPFRSLGSYCAVSARVAQAIRRAGVTLPSRGAAHLLRHSVATSLLRHGASLQDIATLLRHRSIQTTQIYAKVDVLSLSQIAQPWPEVRSC
jgi:integrase/recombinase XerD